MFSGVFGLHGDCREKGGLNAVGFDKGLGKVWVAVDLGYDYFWEAEIGSRCVMSQILSSCQVVRINFPRDRRVGRGKSLTAADSLFWHISMSS